MPRTPLAVPLVISTIVHGLLLALLLLGGRFSWPAPPIPIEVKPARHVKRDKPVEPTPPRAPQPPAQPGAGNTQKRPRPKLPPAPPPPPETKDLSPLAPEDAHLVVLLRMDKLRKSPHRSGTEALLRALPDWTTLVAGTDVSPIDDLEALLIATPDPHDATVTFLAARHADTPKLRALSQRRLPDGDPRVFRTLSPGLTVLTQPGAARQLDGASDMGDARRQWLQKLVEFDRVADAATGPAVLVTFSDVPSLVSFGGGLPTPLAMALATTADASPSVRAQLVFADGKAAQLFADQWPEILRRYRTATALLGLSGALDQLKLTLHEATVELAGPIPEAQVRLALNFARALLPEQQALDGGAR